MFNSRTLYACPHTAQSKRDEYTASTIPLHPMPALREAFEESANELSVHARLALSPTLEQSEESPPDDESWISRWNQETSARYHPLLKTMAQIVFGMHILYEGKTSPEAKVISTIRNHVGIIDDFLDETDEVLGSALKDVSRDIHALQLLANGQDLTPKMTSHMANFEETLRHTSLILDAVIHDTDELASANRLLHQYVLQVKRDWPRKTSAQFTCFVAMRGNKDGWDRYICQLRVDVEKLLRAKTQLQSLVDTWQVK